MYVFIWFLALHYVIHSPDWLWHFPWLGLLLQLLTVYIQKRIKISYNLLYPLPHWDPVFPSEPRVTSHSCASIHLLAFTLKIHISAVSGTYRQCVPGFPVTFSLQIRTYFLCPPLVLALFSSTSPCAADPSFSSDLLLPMGFAPSVNITGYAVYC